MLEFHENTWIFNLPFSDARLLKITFINVIKIFLTNEKNFEKFWDFLNSFSMKYSLVVSL